MPINAKDIEFLKAQSLVNAGPFEKTIYLSLLTRVHVEDRAAYQSVLDQYSDSDLEALEACLNTFDPGRMSNAHVVTQDAVSIDYEQAILTSANNIMREVQDKLSALRKKFKPF